MKKENIKVSQTSLLMGPEREKRVIKSMYHLGLYLFPNFLGCLIVDSQLKEGTCSDDSEELCKVHIKFFALLDASEVSNIFPDNFLSDCFNEPLSQNLLGISNDGLFFSQNFLETTLSEERNISWISLINSTKEHYQYFLGLNIRNHEDVPYFVGQFFFCRTFTNILHSHQFFNGSHCMLLKVVVKTFFLFLNLRTLRTTLLLSDDGVFQISLFGFLNFWTECSKELWLVFFFIEDVIGRKLSCSIGCQTVFLIGHVEQFIKQQFQTSIYTPYPPFNLPISLLLTNTSLNLNQPFISYQREEPSSLHSSRLIQSLFLDNFRSHKNFDYITQTLEVSGVLDSYPAYNQKYQQQCKHINSICIPKRLIFFFLSSFLL